MRDAFAVALVLAAAPLAAAPKQHFVVRGTAQATVAGPGCCGSTLFRGPAELAYSVDGAGQVVVSNVAVRLDDMDIPIRGIFDIVVGNVPVRCATLTNGGFAAGNTDGPARLKLPAGSTQIEGLSFSERVSAAECVDPNLVLRAVNDVPLTIEHDPAGNRFHLAGSFRATHEGGDYALGLQVEATYVNRPPTARPGLLYPGHEQGGCPARWVPNPAGWVAEANGPSGLTAELWSDSADPDGTWARADVQVERWLWAQDTGPELVVGAGRRLGPLTFAFGPLHRLALLVSDTFGASGEGRCEFRVVDSTPPAVTPPPDATLACTEWGGAAPRTSSPLRAFLASARATDVVDTAPAWLAPLAGGAPVSDTTLFRLDSDLAGAGTLVTFQSRDSAGNLGTATSRVHVVDTERPSLAVSVTPALLPPNGKFYVITASVSAADRCGPVDVWLEAIKSDAPELDAADIGGATFGTDDRSFYVRARTRAAGVPRTYRVLYGTKDRFGNRTYAEATVRVSAF
jgi:hypothetical protein